MNFSHHELAFALGGLAGNNAHGAGFLQAATDEGVRPAMISCTSGQIRWTYQFLRDPSERQRSLRQIMQDDIASMDPLKIKLLDFFQAVAQGVPGVLRPVWQDWPLEYLENVAAALQRMLRDPLNAIPPIEFLRTIPSRVLAPEHPPGYFEDMSRVLNSTEVGVVFNSFNPVDGTEIVYLNEAARKLLTKTKSKGASKKYLPGERSSYRHRTSYQNISPTGLRDALWLYNYGFDSEDRPDAYALDIDGAYFRQIILNELTPVKCIIVVRPLNHRWIGALPKNWADLEDLKTKMIFNGTYDGERHQILLINKLVDKNGLDPGDYHPIVLIELEMQRPRGFVDYMFEDMDVFEDSYKRGRELLSQHRLHQEHR
ncbi:MAG TPA: hypothetical protein VK395_30305 [Gemmataceae bacterium]|nr:hypothetical protein [Gemmataceae bacterium]